MGVPVDKPYKAAVAVVMITLNEGHNMRAVLENVVHWAQQIFVVDSYSQDRTVDIALQYGAHVVQRRFRGFGDQWNFALNQLPIKTPWTMKLDPDERLTNELKSSIEAAIKSGSHTGYSFDRRLWFMGNPLPVKQEILRVWKTGACSFKDVLVNEHPLLAGPTLKLPGFLEHHDSPDLDHWLAKQNLYSTAEAVMLFRKSELAERPTLFGSSLQRRMWLKKYFRHFPGRYWALFFYHWIFQGAWRAGATGFIWARLRVVVMRLIEYKHLEMELTGRLPIKRVYGAGKPDPRVRQY